LPIPKPTSGESESDFMARCLGNQTMQTEYSSRNQRVAVCLSQYRGKEGQSMARQNLKREIEKDVFTTEEEALERANEIGCTGTHTHDADGQLIYMPCASHADYTRLTGEELTTPKEDEQAQEGKLEFEAELKAYGEDDEMKGEFTGYASVFGNVDLGGDIVERGAFQKSLRRKGYRKVKMLYQHDTKQPIGVFDMIKEDENGLFVKGRLAMQTQKGKEVFELMKMGAIDGLSVGYRVDAKGYAYDDKRKKRRLKEVDLMEISAVTFPMNPKANLVSVKSDRTIREWETFLREEGGLSRSESKMGANALTKALNQREVGDEQKNDLVASLRNLTQIIKK